MPRWAVLQMPTLARPMKHSCSATQAVVNIMAAAMLDSRDFMRIRTSLPSFSRGALEGRPNNLEYPVQQGAPAEVYLDHQHKYPAL